ncbi:MAG: glycerol kinase GlpK [Sedimentisphaerales bacterium]|nr:glycerol kinase GlpK [Sedimentisphaerales bacterium]
MSEPYILAIDQGTSGTKAVIFDRNGAILSKANTPLSCIYPSAGWVEQDPEQIYANVIDAVRACTQRFQFQSGDLRQITCCGISNQRETFLLWDQGGRPLYNAIVWQCKRSVGICNRLKGTGIEEQVHRSTGLIIDPYFSGTKLVWLCENDREVHQAIKAGQAIFGTVDTWLLYRLTGGKCLLTDHTNASRTLLFNIDTLNWDEAIIEGLGLKGIVLPRPVPSAYHFGTTDLEGILPQPIPITAVIGDSHAAAFGECCFGPGMAKATLGTGCSILLNTGNKRMDSRHGMVSTICWSIPDRVNYALEGIIVSCGSTIQWMRDQLGMFAESAQTEAMAHSIPSTDGVYLIPAFSGLGAPHWQMDMRAAILGMTLGTKKEHLVRAALESIAYQIKDVIAAMEKDSGIALQQLRVDGGISTNRFVMQFLANLLGNEVVNIGIQDVSALGAAYLAGLQAGIYTDLQQIASLPTQARAFHPGPKEDQMRAARSHHGWLEAIRLLTGNK